MPLPQFHPMPRALSVRSKAFNKAPLSWVAKSLGAFGGSQENRSRTNGFDAVAKTVSLNEGIDSRIRSCWTGCIQVHQIHRNCTLWRISKPAFPSQVVCSDVALAYFGVAQERRVCRIEGAQEHIH